jgi:hypothetical protein
MSVETHRFDVTGLEVFMVVIINSDSLVVRNMTPASLVDMKFLQRQSASNIGVGLQKHRNSENNSVADTTQ